MIVLGVLVNPSHRPSSFHGNSLFFRQMSMAGKEVGVKVLICPANKIDFPRRRVIAYSYDLRKNSWYKKSYPLPDVVYNRFFADGDIEARSLRNRVIKGLSNLGIPYFNHKLGDKWKVHHRLCAVEELQTFIPPTVAYPGKAKALKLIEKWNSGYLKPRAGTKGRGIIRISKLANSQFLVELAGSRSGKKVTRQGAMQALNGVNKGYILQKTIFPARIDGKIFDLRIMLQKDENGEWQFTGGAARSSKEGVTCNLHMGASALSLERVSKELAPYGFKVETMQQVSLMFAECLEQYWPGLGELGLDFIVDHNGKIWFIEANPKPGRAIFHKLGDQGARKLAVSRPLEYAKYLAVQKE